MKKLTIASKVTFAVLGLTLLNLVTVAILRPDPGQCGKGVVAFTWEDSKGFSDFKLSSDLGSGWRASVLRRIYATQLRAQISHLLRTDKGGDWRRIRGRAGFAVLNFSLLTYVNGWRDDVYYLEDPDITVLMRAAHDGSTSQVIDLISQKVSINAVDQNGFTALTWACKGSNAGTEIVSALIHAGADPNHRDGQGFAPIFWAASQGHVEQVSALLVSGANVNKLDDKHRSPLFYAASNGELRTVEMLLAAHAEVALKDVDGETAVSAASKNGHENIVKLVESTARQ